jgi:predicted transcriptional regulator
MAVPKTLTTQIQDLVNSIQEMDRTEIKAKLSRFARLVKALEDGTATRKTEAKIARLKTALGKANEDYEKANAALEQSSVAIGNLQSELQTMQAEIAKYQAERTKEEKRKREMPPIQFKILSGLPSRHSGKPLKVETIAQVVGIPTDEAEVHINKLKKAGLVIAQHNNFAPTVWHRSNDGNELVLARRLAGDAEAQEEKPKPARKHPDLSADEHFALLMMSKSEEGVTASEIAEKLGRMTVKMVELMLTVLEEKGMASDGDEPDYGAGRYWVLLRGGMEYLAERGQY